MTDNRFNGGPSSTLFSLFVPVGNDCPFSVLSSEKWRLDISSNSDFSYSLARRYYNGIMIDLNIVLKNTLIENLGIEIISMSKDKVTGRMPVDERTIQPAGFLHGGASVAFAETLGSIGGIATIDYPRQVPLGIEVNANHIKAVREGWVYGEASPVHLGENTQVWEIHIRDDEQQLIRISRFTLAIVWSR